jgi:hypothetical protein
VGSRPLSDLKRRERESRHERHPPKSLGLPNKACEEDRRA